MNSVPADPVRLVAVDFGRVVVQLVDDKGSELGLRGSADLQVRLNSPEAESFRAFHERVSVPLDSGRSVFGCVGLGYLLSLTIRVDGHETIRQDVRGPTAPGEEVRILIPIRERMATARGRVVGIQEFLADAQASCAWLSGFPGERSAHVPGFFSGWVCEEGFFEYPIQYGSKDLAGPWVLELSSAGGPILRTTVRPTTAEEHSVLDFGDVVFDPEPALARVRVVDDSGAAIRAAMVEVQSGSIRGTRDLDCNEQGHCLLMGSSMELPIRVRAKHASRLPSEWSQIVEPGSEHSLVLRRPAKLEGRLLVPGASSFEDLGLRLQVGPSAASPEGAQYFLNHAEGGRFAFEACEPGQGLLTVLHTDTVVLERGIELRSGETTELEPIDLDGVLHPFELSFALESGDPWSNGWLLLLDQGGAQSSGCGNAPIPGLKPIGPSGRASFLALRPSVDLWATGRGARTALFKNVVTGDRLVLPSAPFVILRVPRKIGLPEPPLVLMVQAWPYSAERSGIPSSPLPNAVVREDGTVHLQVPCPGDYILSWFVRHTGLGANFAVRQEKAQTMHVPETSSFGFIEANLADDAVAKAVLAAGG